MKRAKAYVQEFSHLVKMIEKVKKPSQETIVTMRFILHLLSEKF